MTDVPFPLLSAPGRLPQAAGGRLINTFPEKLPITAGKPYAYWRVAGTKPWGILPTGGIPNFRGALTVSASLTYAVIGNTVYSYGPAGGQGVALTGSVPGTLPVTMARNNAATPDIVIVAPGDGAFTFPLGAGAVAAYPGVTVGQPNAVVFHKGFFIFTYGNGKTQASGVNVLTIATTDNATAESKPDTLFRPIPLGNGQMLLCGDASMEVWGGDPNVGVAGYPFVYVATIARGVVGQYAIAGHEDGWGKGIFLVGDDFKVSTLDGYTPTPISPPDLDLLIENDANKSAIQLNVYVSMGHPFVVVKGTGWCYEYDTSEKAWHERRSHLSQTWRGLLPFRAFNQWYCGDTNSGSLFQLDGNTKAGFAINNVQTLSLTGVPTGGTFTLNFDGQVTAPIPYNATATQVQTALVALSNIDVSDVVVLDGPLPAAMRITFWSALSAKPLPLLFRVNNSLTGGTAPAVLVVNTIPGVRGEPIRMRIETGPLGAFPHPVRINSIELYITKGAGVATGLDPLETDPDVEISISRDGGQVWSSPRVVKIGRQSLTNQRVRAAIWGHAEVQGVRWRFEMSAPVSFGFMGADMQSDTLR